MGLPLPQAKGEQVWLVRSATFPWGRSLSQASRQLQAQYSVRGWCTRSSTSQQPAPHIRKLKAACEVNTGGGPSARPPKTSHHQHLPNPANPLFIYNQPPRPRLHGSHSVAVDNSTAPCNHRLTVDVPLQRPPLIVLVLVAASGPIPTLDISIEANPSTAIASFQRLNRHHVQKQLRQRLRNLLPTRPDIPGRVRRRGCQAGLCRCRHRQQDPRRARCRQEKRRGAVLVPKEALWRRRACRHCHCRPHVGRARAVQLYEAAVPGPPPDLRALHAGAVARQHDWRKGPGEHAALRQAALRRGPAGGGRRRRRPAPVRVPAQRHDRGDGGLCHWRAVADGAHVPREEPRRLCRQRPRDARAPRPARPQGEPGAGQGADGRQHERRHRRARAGGGLGDGQARAGDVQSVRRPGRQGLDRQRRQRRQRRRWWR